MQGIMGGDRVIEAPAWMRVDGWEEAVGYYDS